MKFINSNLFAFITFLGTIFTIFGVNIMQAFEDQTQSWIVFGLLAFLILFSILRIYVVTRNMMVKTYPSGYLTIASFFRYSTSNGKDAIYEQFKHIQVKCAYKVSFEHRFSWTGSNVPEIKSEFQNVGKIIQNEDKFGTKYYETILTSKNSMVFNECDILHNRAIVKDDDAQPYLAQKVTDPIKFLHFKIELLHADLSYKSHAKVVRKAIDKPNSNEEVIVNDINFDFITKSFTYILTNPDVGFYYKIIWVKP